MKASRLERLLRHWGGAKKGRPAMPRKRVAGTVRDLLKHADVLLIAWREQQLDSVKAAAEVAGMEAAGEPLMNGWRQAHLRYARDRANRLEAKANETLRLSHRCREIAHMLEHCNEHDDCKQNAELAKACMTTRRENSRTPI